MRQQLRKLLISILTAGLAVTTVGVGTTGVAGASSSPEHSSSRAPKAKHYTIGMTLLGLQFSFLDQLYAASKTEAKKLGVSLDAVNPNDSVSQELAGVQALIAKKPNAIVMIPVSYQESITAAKLVNKAHIPLFLVNTVLAPSFTKQGGHFVSYIGSSDYQDGLISGRFTAKTLHGHGNVIYIVTQFGDSSTTLRRDGFLHVLKNYPGIHVVSTQQALGLRANAETVMENLLAHFKPGSVDAVVAQNDEMAIGALNAINKAGRRAQFKLIMGSDAEPQVWPYIKNGQITASIFQNAVAQGIGAISVPVAYLNGKPYKHEDIIPYKLVTRSNLTTVIPAAK